MLAGHLLGMFINPDYIPMHMSAALNLLFVFVVVLAADKGHLE